MKFPTAIAFAATIALATAGPVIKYSNTTPCNGKKTSDTCLYQIDYTFPDYSTGAPLRMTCVGGKDTGRCKPDDRTGVMTCQQANQSNCKTTKVGK